MRDIILISQAGGGGLFPPLKGTVMSNIHTHGNDQNSSNLYQVRIKGTLDSQWSERFEGFSITEDDDGNTLLTGPVIDQAALHGLLRKVRDLGVPLISVNRIQANEINLPHSNE